MQKQPIRKRHLIESECAKLAKFIRAESAEYNPVMLPVDKELF